MNEDFRQETTSLSVEDAADAIISASQEQSESDKSEEEAITDEAEELEVEEDQADDDAEEEEAEEADETEELWFEIDGEEVSVAQIKEWQEGSLRLSDYTKKTQAVAADRKQVEADRSEASQELQSLREERAQLQNALATLAIDADKEPDWAEMAQTTDPQQVLIEQGKWRKRQAEKQQAAAVYQELQQQQSKDRQGEQLRAAVRARPEWGTDDGWAPAQEAIISAASEFGISGEEVFGLQMDHRSLLVLHEFAQTKAKLAKFEKQTAEVKKKVVKAEPRRGPGLRPSKNQSKSKAAKAKQATFAKTRKLDDAVDAVMASLKSD